LSKANEEQRAQFFELLDSSGKSEREIATLVNGVLGEMYMRVPD